jgi:polyisoprenoid-binding protein YceI
LLGLALVFPVCSLQAQQATFELDPAKTKIDFTLGDVLHTVHGTFKAKSGTVQFDLASGNGSGEFIVDAASGESGNNTRDRKMHKEILESDKFPEIAFRPVHVTGTIGPVGDSTVQVQGIFRIHGADHPLTLSVPLHNAGGNLTGSLKFAVPYVAWGLKDPSTFVLRVSKEVEIDIAVSGHLTPAPAAK